MKKKNKIALWISAAILVVSGVIWGIIKLMPVKIPDVKTQGEAAIKFAASKEFRSLSEAERQKYLKSLRESRDTKFREKISKLPEADRKALMGNMMEARMAEEKAFLKKFSKMTREQKIAAIDQRIAERDKRRKEMEANRQKRQTQQAASPAGDSKSSGNPPGGRRQPPSAQMQRDFYESMEPSTRALMREYRQMERLRRAGKL